MRRSMRARLPGVAAARWSAGDAGWVVFAQAAGGASSLPSRSARLVGLGGAEPGADRLLQRGAVDRPHAPAHGAAGVGERDHLAAAVAGAGAALDQARLLHAAEQARQAVLRQQQPLLQLEGAHAALRRRARARAARRTSRAAAGRPPSAPTPRGRAPPGGRAAGAPRRGRRIRRVPRSWTQYSDSCSCIKLDIRCMCIYLDACASGPIHREDRTDEDQPEDHRHRRRAPGAAAPALAQSQLIANAGLTPAEARA